MALGQDVEMSVTIEQVESVPVPDTPVVASEPATPVPVASYYKFCIQCGARSASVSAKWELDINSRFEFDYFLN